jgi:hypothetical protein
MSAAPKSKAKPKKMGRPPKPGGRDVLVAGRVPPSTAAKLDAIAKKYGYTRSETIRRVIEASAVVADIELKPRSTMPKAKREK